MGTFQVVELQIILIGDNVKEFEFQQILDFSWQASSQLF